MCLIHREHDLNGDGFITVDELHETLTKMGKHYTKAELKIMIKKFDVDRDGKISFREFKKILN